MIIKSAEKDLNKWGGMRIPRKRLLSVPPFSFLKISRHTLAEKTPIVLSVLHQHTFRYIPPPFSYFLAVFSIHTAVLIMTIIFTTTTTTIIIIMRVAIIQLSQSHLGF